MADRESGFYWVRKRGSWEVAEYNNSDQDSSVHGWYRIESYECNDDSFWTDIDERVERKGDADA